MSVGPDDKLAGPARLNWTDFCRPSTRPGICAQCSRKSRLVDASFWALGRLDADYLVARMP